MNQWVDSSCHVCYNIQADGFSQMHLLDRWIDASPQLTRFRADSPQLCSPFLLAEVMCTFVRLMDTDGRNHYGWVEVKLVMWISVKECVQYSPLTFPNEVTSFHHVSKILLQRIEFVLNLGVLIIILKFGLHSAVCLKCIPGNYITV